MNSSEQKQIYSLGRMLFRDAERVQKLINSEQLNVSSEVSEFTETVIRVTHGHVRPQDIRQIYEQNFSNRAHSEEYEKVAQIFSSQQEAVG